MKYKMIIWNCYIKRKRNEKYNDPIFSFEFQKSLALIKGRFLFENKEKNQPSQKLF